MMAALTSTKRIPSTSIHNTPIAWVYVTMFGTSTCSLLINAVGGAMAARLLTPHGRGEWAVISYFPGLIGTIFCLSIPQALTYFVSKDPSREPEYAAAAFRVSLLLGVLGSAIFAVLAPLSLANESRALTGAVVVACGVSPFMVITPHLDAINWGMRRFAWCNTVRVGAALLNIAALLLLWVGNWVSPLSVAVSALIGQGLLATLHAWRIGFHLLFGSVSRPVYSRIVRQGLTFFVPVIALTIFNSADRAILIRTTTVQEIGYFAVAFALAVPITMVTEPFATIGFVEASSADDSNSSISLVLRRFQLAQVLVCFVAIPFALILSPVIQFAFGSKFLPAVRVAYPLLAAMSLRALGRSLENALRALNMTRPGIVAGIAGMLWLVPVSFAIVPSRGAMGYALALLTAQIVSLSVLLISVSLRLHVSVWQLWGLRIRTIRPAIEMLSRFARMSVRECPPTAALKSVSKAGSCGS